jgi:hypothetical protein
MHFIPAYPAVQAIARLAARKQPALNTCFSGPQSAFAVPHKTTGTLRIDIHRALRIATGRTTGSDSKANCSATKGARSWVWRDSPTSNAPSAPSRRYSFAKPPVFGDMFIQETMSYKISKPHPGPGFCLIPPPTMLIQINSLSIQRR